MSRVKFAESMGATTKNASNAWSYVNHEENFVLFAAWSGGETIDSQHIFSTSWIKDAKGHKPKGYAASLRHLEHIMEDDYGLRTFRQFQKDDDGTGIPKVKKFEASYESRSLIVVGGEYYAMKQAISDIEGSQARSSDFWEGRKTEVLQTQYERSPEARAKCLSHYGASCRVCKFGFGNEFGSIGFGFIHVHHLVPVSERNTIYKVDPVKDLRPVCPNCHAMIHKRHPPFTIDEMREIRASGKTSQ